MSALKFPYEIQNVDSDLCKELMEMFKGVREGFVQVGPKKYIFNPAYKLEAELFYNLPLRADDIWVVTFPRSGTTWVQDIVWLIQNDLDFETAKKLHIAERYTFTQVTAIRDLTQDKRFLETIKPEHKSVVQALLTPKFTKLELQASPRFIKSHSPFSLLPPQLLETSKVVYVLRDPRDVALSYYRHQKLLKTHSFVGDFRTFWKYFKKGLVYYGPYFEHIKEAWEQRNHKNMLLLFYEDLCNDLPSNLKRISTFFNKNLNEQQISLLCDYLNFDKFKNNTSVNFEAMTDIGWFNDGAETFFFQGKPGGWQELFDDDMKKEAQEWIEDNLRGTDIRFSEGSS